MSRGTRSRTAISRAAAKASAYRPRPLLQTARRETGDLQGVSIVPCLDELLVDCGHLGEESGRPW